MTLRPNSDYDHKNSEIVVTQLEAEYLILNEIKKLDPFLAEEEEKILLVFNICESSLLQTEFGIDDPTYHEEGLKLKNDIFFTINVDS